MWIASEIAIELFQTFLTCGLIRNHFASNIGVVKSKIWGKINCIRNTSRSYTWASNIAE